MSKAKRPTGVTVIAILNIVFGSLGLFGSLCGLASTAMGNAFQPPAAAGKDDPAKVFQAELDKEDPNNKVVATASMVVSVITSALLLVSGIGLLRLSGWARTLAIVLALIQIVVGLANAGYGIAVSLPAAQRAMENTEKTLAKQNDPATNAAVKAMGVMATILPGITIGMAALALIYYAIVLIVLNGAKAKAAFTGESERNEDFDDHRRDRDDRDDDIDDRRRDG